MQCLLLSLPEGTRSENEDLEGPYLPSSEGLHESIVAECVRLVSSQVEVQEVSKS